MAEFSVSGLMTQFSNFDQGGIGAYAFLGVILFLLALGVIGMLVLAFIALKKNWIILKYPITVLLLKPTGETVQPFLDKAAIISEGKEERWKLKQGGYTFTPPSREYITPGNWFFAWSSTYREIIPLKMSVFGYMKNADPQAVNELMGKIKQLDAQVKAIEENPDQFENLAALPQGQKAQAIEGIKEQVEEKKKELYDAFEKQQKTYEMALKPRVDTAIMNSMYAEGEKHIRQHKTNDSLLMYAGLVLTLIIVIVSLMLSAAQGMAYADGQKELAKSVQANADTMRMMLTYINGTNPSIITAPRK